MRAFSPYLPPARRPTSPTTPQAPVFTTQPTNQEVAEDANATFPSLAVGPPVPTYQWWVDDGGGYDAISGATNRILTLVAVTAAMDGYTYKCIATNSEGSTTSDEVTLTITDSSELMSLDDEQISLDDEDVSLQ